MANAWYTLRRNSGKAAAVLGVISVCVVFKLLFAEADALALDWLLYPTSTMVALCSDRHFIPMGGEGYLDASGNIFIVPGCSGLNFFIILTAAGGCFVALSPYSVRSRLVWCAVMPGLAYAATLLVNTQRILLAIFLYGRDITALPLSPEQLHRIEGVSVYYIYLCLFIMLLSRLLPVFADAPCEESAGGGNRRSDGFACAARMALPLLCYLFFTVGIPLANGALLSEPALFIEHGLTILLLCAVLTPVLYHLLWRKKTRPAPGTQKDAGGLH